MKKKAPGTTLFYMVSKISFIILAVCLCWNYVISAVYIKGNNMFPSVKDGDLCFIYRLGSFYTNDVVVYKSKDTIRIGRIAAISGQEVDFPSEGGYTVNGWQPSEQITYQTYQAKNSKVEYPFTVPDGKCFILNDFRSDTGDSREFGCVEEADIIGKVVFMVRRRGI